MSKLELLRVYSQSLLEYSKDCPAWMFQDIKLHLTALNDFGAGKQLQSKESLGVHLTELRQFHRNLLQRHYPTYCLLTAKLEALEKCIKSMVGLTLIDYQVLTKQLYASAGREKQKKISTVFLGHGQSRCWNKLLDFLQADMDVEQTVYFDKPYRVDHVTRESLGEMTKDLDFAIIVIAPEDEALATTKQHARSQALYEIAYMQGCLGDKRVAILKQEGVDDFIEIEGLNYITFSKDKIEQSFYELSRKFKHIEG
ncbi:MAG: nucleotide-binding protein [Candidatus Melainabacteria bacterium]|jgi:predicted nucleotide-binding protein|nr:nucleotide-binding protein [Candidatus Melainabacteria bacterium]